MDEASLDVCIREAGRLFDDVYRWLIETREDLVRD